MPPTWPREPHPEGPPGPADAAPSWAADAAEAAPAPPGAVPETAQMPLFPAAGPGPAPARHARLRGQIKALLSPAAGRETGSRDADTGGPPNSSWPDSFFDDDART